jgi:nicotinamide mononucleotide transporter
MLHTLWAQLLATTPPEWIGIVTGITGVYLSIKEKLAAWPLFIFCYAAYIYISYQYGLKAFMMMNAIFIGISIYGWYKWSQRTPGTEEHVHVSHTPLKQLCIALALLALSTAAIGGILDRLGEAQVPYWDAFATSCGFVAQWMLSRKHVETWIFWIITDLIYIRLLGEQGSLTSVVLFSVFIVLAIKGWNDWRTSMSTSHQVAA